MNIGATFSPQLSDQKEALGGVEGMGSATASIDPITVLLVDDQPLIGEAVRRMLHGEAGIQFRYCVNPSEAIATAREVQPTVILQDLVMPNISGLDLVRQYRSDPKLYQIPIIVLSTKEEAAVKSEAFGVGANDYLVKLPDRIELIARLRYHSVAYLSLIQRDEAYRALRKSQEELLEVNRELQRLTNVDGLTGLSNRRYFDEYFATEWRQALRANEPISMLMVDIDHFKQYNDTYGHLAGDEVLKTVAQAVQATFQRPRDLAVRLGGEEFAVVLPQTPARDVLALANKAVSAVKALAIPHRASSAADCVTISVGAATCIPVRDEQPLSLLEAADKTMYQAKQTGRNRAVAGDGTGPSA
jgi:two-component system chemotaxis family response regulator WspR